MRNDPQVDSNLLCGLEKNIRDTSQRGSCNQPLKEQVMGENS